MPLLTALWQGCFTAVSAFCNAGFSLNPDSLTSYQTSAFVLHLVALLIICGGLAPATLLMIPQWMRRRKIDLTARLTLVTTLILLISGMILMLAFEWNGLFQGLSVTDKLHNAWFHAATLRTAGFNSVDTAAAGAPGFLVMLVFMFIGGSPGGTAGGVKTTTIAVLALTFYTTITGARDIVIRNQRISGQIVNRAVTILISVLLVWFVLVLMLAVTQPGIPVRDLIFEAVSAMTTTGLSTGATVMLDDMGKIIISLAMFCGRIGPMTLFMILGNDPPPSRAGCPDARIFLT
jgi:trk system potassium uptake protein